MPFYPQKPRHEMGITCKRLAASCPRKSLKYNDIWSERFAKLRRSRARGLALIAKNSNTPRLAQQSYKNSPKRYCDVGEKLAIPAILKRRIRNTLVILLHAINGFQ